MALFTILVFLPSITSHIVRIKISEVGFVKKLVSAFLTSTPIVCRENSARTSDLLAVLSKNIWHTLQVGQVSTIMVIERLARLAMKFLSARVRISTPGMTNLAKSTYSSLTFLNSDPTLKISKTNVSAFFELLERRFSTWLAINVRKTVRAGKKTLCWWYLFKTRRLLSASYCCRHSSSLA